MIISAIVACGENGEIGRAGGLPWPTLRSDLHWFRKCTLGKPIICGRGTWDSLPVRPLAGRPNIVLTSKPGDHLDWVMEGSDDAPVWVLPDVASALALYPDAPEVVVIGGQPLYALLWDRIDRWYVTKVEINDALADRHIPYPFSPYAWDETPAFDRYFVDGKSGIRMGFYIYERKKEAR